MRIPVIFASTVVHGTVIVGLGLWVQPWVQLYPLEVTVTVAPQEAVPEVLSRLPEPKKVRVEPCPETPLSEPEFFDLEEPEPEPEAEIILGEPPLPLPYPTLKPIPELIHRVLPVVVKPLVAEAAAKPPTEEALEPRLPRDYVQDLHLDPRNKPPKYPALARRLGIEGTLVIAVTVTPDGRAGAVRVLTAAGTSAAHKQMETATLRALKHWHYPKILQGDQPVQMVIHVPVEFRLVDNG